MEKTLGAVVLAASLALSSSPVLADTMVKEVDVLVDLAAIQDIEAAREWKNIEGDLETAIVERLVGKISPDGSVIVIDVDELEIANAFQSSLGIAGSKLMGEVEVKKPGILNNETYILTVTAEQAKTYFPADLDVTVLNTGSAEFYAAMIDAFAEGVVADLNE